MGELGAGERAVIGSVVCVIYFVPAILALGLNRRNAAAILLLNLLLGWVGVGWVVALAWALAADGESARRRHAAPTFLACACAHCAAAAHIPASLAGELVTCGACRRQYPATPARYAPG